LSTTPVSDDDRGREREATLVLIASVVSAVRDWEATRGRRANRRFLRDLVYEYWERPAYGDNGGFSARLFWSQAARALRTSNLSEGLPPNRGLQRDHVVPVKLLWQLMIDEPNLTLARVGEILSQLEVRVVTNQEHLKVEAVRRQHPEIEGWAVYDHAGLARSQFSRLT
jgi:hypothetical protein